MISLILPYWERQKAADRAIAALDKCYAGMDDLEIVLIDNASPTPFVEPQHDLNMKVVRLQPSNEAGGLVRSLTTGVSAATGDIIVLSFVEVIHERPVLRQLVDTLKDEKDYALAAAWCPEHKAWHCHSSIDPPHTPKGTGFAFCAAMRKELYYASGGFDPDYDNGSGYEDCDFVMRLVSVGANFIHRDDLVVIHPKTDATSPHIPERFERNRQKFYAKWKNA